MESQFVQSSLKGIEGKLTPLQEKLDRLTPRYFDELIDEDSYRRINDEVLLEKNALKREKERLQRTGVNRWVEPARDVVNRLETLGKTDF